MSLKKRQLRKSRLCVIIDSDSCSGRLISIAKQSINAGADIIQYRAKNGSARDRLRKAKTLRALAQNKALFIINDYIDLALALGADGVQLGQDDMPIEAARKILGKRMLIGISCHSLKQAKQAQQGRADFIGIGPIFSTPTKPKTRPIGFKVLSEIKRSIKIPFFAIGGINQKNIKQIVDSGVSRIAVIRAVCKSKDINKSINNFKSILN